MNKIYTNDIIKKTKKGKKLLKTAYEGYIICQKGKIMV